jgi:small-conductance mechanosensitive channel
VIDFLASIWDELVRSFVETFDLFNREGEGAVAGLAELISRLIVAALIALIFLMVYRVLRRALRFAVTKTRLPDDIAQPLTVALRYTVLVLAALAILSRFGVGDAVLSNTALSSVFAFIFYLGWVVVNRLLANAVHATGLDRSLEQLLRNVLAVLVGAIAFVTIMDLYGVDVLGVITALGVVGIAVGFAAQETLSNFIAGITLLVERPFKIGDWVQLGGRTGRVELITLRTTRMVDRNNILMSLPNATVASSDIVNLSAGGPLRIALLVGIAYKESAKRAREVLMPVLEAHPEVLAVAERSPAVLLEELGDSSVNLTLYYWVAPGSIGVSPRISAELLEGAKEALDDAGIEIPFPHLQLFVDEAKGLMPVAEALRS